MALHQYLSIYESAIMLVLLDGCISDLWGFYLTLTDILTEQKQQLCEDCCTLQYTSLFIRFNPCLVCVYYIWTWLRAVEEHNCISGRKHHSLWIFFSQLLEKMKDLSKKKKKKLSFFSVYSQTSENKHRALMFFSFSSFYLFSHTHRWPKFVKTKGHNKAGWTCHQHELNNKCLIQISSQHGGTEEPPSSPPTLFSHFWSEQGWSQSSVWIAGFLLHLFSSQWVSRRAFQVWASAGGGVILQGHTIQTEATWK